MKKDQPERKINRHLTGAGMHGKTHSRSGYGRRAAGFVLRTGSLIACDQLTKLLAYRGLRQSGKGSVSLIPGVLELRYLENRGAAFGILQGRGPVFSIFAILIATLAAWIFLKSPDGKRFRPLRISMAGLTAGAAGNLIDRMLRGYVIDFIYFSIIDFPVFNVADICITLSVALLLILLLFVYGEGDFAWLGRRKSGGMSRRNFREESPHEDRSGNEESQYDRNGKDV